MGWHPYNEPAASSFKKQKLHSNPRTPKINPWAGDSTAMVYWNNCEQCFIGWADIHWTGGRQCFIDQLRTDRNSRDPWNACPLELGKCWDPWNALYFTINGLRGVAMSSLHHLSVCILLDCPKCDIFSECFGTWNLALKPLQNMGAMGSMGCVGSYLTLYNRFFGHYYFLQAPIC